MPQQTTNNRSAGGRVDAIAEWRSGFAALTGAVLLYLTLTGVAITVLPTARINEFGVVLHTVIGLLATAPVAVYLVRHWRDRRAGGFSHYQLLGYASAAVLLVCFATGVIETWQAIAGTRVDPALGTWHLATGLATAILIVLHLVTVLVRKMVREEMRTRMHEARMVYARRSILGCVAGAVVWVGWYAAYEDYPIRVPFSDEYNWRFGEDRPFAPSLARLDAGGLEGSTREHGAVASGALADSARCGTSGCHEEIYREWLPSAHRYSSLDDMFQRVQTLMAEETSPEQTRYCAGCHDPISLLSGSKNAGNITLSAEGSDEGASCLVCHSIVQTDVQGNGDYTIRPPRLTAYERHEGPVARVVSDFIIRSLPRPHVEAYSRPLYKTPEFCAACHKQYIDKEVNTDIGKVQGQNQYDSWKNSRWHTEGDERATISCRECHMPLVDSLDPARGDVVDWNRAGDDYRHRSHGMAASNQYVPLIHDLEGAEEHVAAVERWLRGELEIPEIADRWVDGPVVRLSIDAPEEVVAGADVPIRVRLTNNKTGHDFPTGPLDMIDSWVELTVTDASGVVVFQTGALDEDDRIQESPVEFRADGFDRRGELIDRHNLWDLVGASYKRSMFPGVTDTVEVTFQCPSMARKRVRDEERVAPGVRIDEFSFGAPVVVGDLTVTARLLYRKANPMFLDRVYGITSDVRSPVTEMSRESATIRLAAASDE